MSFKEYAQKIRNAPSTSRSVSVCPECGCELTYVGFTNVECGTNAFCTNYRERTLPIKIEMRPLTKDDVFFAKLATQAGAPVTVPPAPVAGGQNVAWARCWMANGGKIEARAKQPGSAGLWMPIYGVADLASIQGKLSDKDFDDLFDFRVA